ncbi:MAG: hypothetical protein WCD53_28835, partial [Microcoleus sp.]
IASSIVCGQGCRCGILLSLQPFSSNLNLFCDIFKLLIFIVCRDQFLWLLTRSPLYLKSSRLSSI